jgi:hypothetical protein
LNCLRVSKLIQRPRPKLLKEDFVGFLPEHELPGDQVAGNDSNGNGNANSTTIQNEMTAVLAAQLGRPRGNCSGKI